MLVTPFHDDYRLNEDALRREVQWAIAAGAHGLVAASADVDDDRRDLGATRGIFGSLL